MQYFHCEKINQYPQKRLTEYDDDEYRQWIRTKQAFKLHVHPSTLTRNFHYADKYPFYAKKKSWKLKWQTCVESECQCPYVLIPKFASNAQIVS